MCFLLPNITRGYIVSLVSNEQHEPERNKVKAHKLTDAKLDNLKTRYGFAVAREVASNAGARLCDHCASASIASIALPCEEGQSDSLCAACTDECDRDAEHQEYLDECETMAADSLC